MALSDATRLADFGSGIGTDSTLDLNNINATGVVTATSFVGALTGNAAGLTGTPNITVADISSTNIVASAATITGNLQVKGTQTVINTDVLEVADLNIGIASTSTKLSNANLDGAGITIYGSDEDKTLIWDNSNTRMSFNTDFYADNVFTTSAVVGSAVTTDSQGIRVAGIVTATSFTGDGSGLSGVESWNQQDTWLYGGG